MTINKVNDGAAVKYEVEGRLDTTTAPELEQALSGEEGNEIVFDFSKLEYISSAGLRVLLSEQKAVNARSGKMVIRNVNDTIMEVFEITGFIDILTIE